MQKSNVAVLGLTSVAVCAVAGFAFYKPSIDAPVKNSYVSVDSGPEKGLQGDLHISDVTIGTGAEVKSGDKLRCHYTGWLADGSKFDSSEDRGQPFEFVLGQGQVIKGWDVGLQKMRVGGTRRLIIPPHMAYGSKGAGSLIPPDSTLTFKVEVLQAN